MLRSVLTAMVNGEVKGRVNNEIEIARVVQLLQGFDVLFEVTAMDLGRSDLASVEKHRASLLRQYDDGIAQLRTRLGNGTGDRQDQSDLRNLTGLRQNLASLDRQLHVQSFITLHLIDRILELAPVYYSQRRSAELSNFAWVVDAHGANKTLSWETWWSELILPQLQLESLRRPGIRAPFGDYSQMVEFELDLRDLGRTRLERQAAYWGTSVDLMLEMAAPMHNLSLLLRDIRFSPTREFGLELVDILCNAVRRALRGALQLPGWIDIPRLMLNRPHQYIYLMGFGLQGRGPAVPLFDTPYSFVAQHFCRGGKPIMTRTTALEHPGFDYWEWSRFNQKLVGTKPTRQADEAEGA